MKRITAQIVLDNATAAAKVMGTAVNGIFPGMAWQG